MPRFEEPVWEDENSDHIWDSHKVREFETEEVIHNPETRHFRVGSSVDSRRYLFLGQTDGGRFLAVFVDALTEGRYYVVTARDVTETERRRYRRR